MTLQCVHANMYHICMVSAEAQIFTDAVSIPQVLEEAGSDTGGFKLAIASIAGRGVYGRLKFESGVHRVQRVPATESSGRVHTSAASVAIMPQADEVTHLPLHP